MQEVSNKMRSAFTGKGTAEYFVHAFLAVIVYSFLPDRSLLEMCS